MVEGYHLPRIMFSENEARSFLVAQKLIEKMTDPSINILFTEAVNKVKAIIRSEARNNLEDMEDNIFVVERLPSQINLDNNRVQLILDGIAQKNKLTIAYQAIYERNITERVIEPIGIQFHSSYWHLIAYCELRKAYRDFRIDRIKELKLNAEKFSNNHPSFKSYLNEIITKKAFKKVIVSFSKKAARIANTQKYFYGFIEEKEVNDRIVFSFLSPSLDGIAQWLLVFTNEVSIVEPIELKALMIKLTDQLIENYKN